MSDKGDRPANETDIIEIKSQLDSVEDTLDKVVKCVRGHKDNHTDSGLTGSVSRNTEYINECKDMNLIDKVKSNTTLRNWLAGASVTILGAVVTGGIYYVFRIIL